MQCPFAVLCISDNVPFPNIPITKVPHVYLTMHSFNSAPLFSALCTEKEVNLVHSYMEQRCIELKSLCALLKNFILEMLSLKTRAHRQKIYVFSSFLALYERVCQLYSVSEGKKHSHCNEVPLPVKNSPIYSNRVVSFPKR